MNDIHPVIRLLREIKTEFESPNFIYTEWRNPKSRGPKCLHVKIKGNRYGDGKHVELMIVESHKHRSIFDPEALSQLHNDIEASYIDIEGALVFPTVTKTEPGELPDVVSTHWVLNQLSGMEFPEQGSAYAFIKNCLQKGTPR